MKYRNLHLSVPAVILFLIAGCGSRTETITPVPGPMPLNDGQVQRYLKVTTYGLNSWDQVLWKDQGVLVEPCPRIYALAESLNRAGKQWLDKTQQFNPSGRPTYIGPEYDGIAVVVSLDPDIAVASISPISPTHPENSFADWRNTSKINSSLVDFLGWLDLPPGYKFGTYAGVKAPLGGDMMVVSKTGVLKNFDHGEALAGFDIVIDGSTFHFEMSDAGTITCSKK